jgi:electron transport complex protein RnfE
VRNLVGILPGKSRATTTKIPLTLGGMRELVGQGTIFDQAHLMFGEAAQEFTIRIKDFPGMLIMLKNLIGQRLSARAVEKADYPEGAEHEF